MTSDSQESSQKHIQELHQKHRRATRAMLNHLVVRSHEDYKHLPILDDESLQNDIRAAIWSTEYELVQADPDRLNRPDAPLNLAEAMANSHLEDLATPGRPLTIDRLLHIDPKLVPIADRIAETDISWPSDETVFHDVLPSDYDDYAFAFRLAEGSGAHNNFPKLLMTAPSYPEPGEHYIAFMHRTPMHHYATKPYLARAYALQPEFMLALQSAMAKINSPQEWRQRLLDASENDDADPEDLVLLRASRLSYQLLINLMRSDDNKTQAKITTMSLHNTITNPVEELWT